MDGAESLAYGESGPFRINEDGPGTVSLSVGMR